MINPRRLLGVIVHVLDGYRVILDDLLVKFLYCLQVRLLLGFGMTKISYFFVVFTLLKRCLRVYIDVYPVLKDRYADRTIIAIVTFPCDFRQKDNDICIHLLEMRIVLSYLILMNQIDQPGRLILMDLFQQIVDIQSQPTWVGQHICQQLCWIFGPKPFEFKIVFSHIAVPIADQSIVELDCRTIFILKLVELLQPSYWGLLLFFQTQIEVFLQQGSLELINFWFMRGVLSFHMLTMVILYLL